MLNISINPRDITVHAVMCVRSTGCWPPLSEPVLQISTAELSTGEKTDDKNERRIKNKNRLSITWAWLADRRVDWSGEKKKTNAAEPGK